MILKEDVTDPHKIYKIETMIRCSSITDNKRCRRWGWLYRIQGIMLSSTVGLCGKHRRIWRKQGYKLVQQPLRWQGGHWHYDGRDKRYNNHRFRNSNDRPQVGVLRMEWEYVLESRIGLAIRLQCYASKFFTNLYAQTTQVGR